MRKTSLLLASLMLIAILSACSGKSEAPGTTTTPEATENSGNTAPETGNNTTPESTPSAEEAKIIANKQLVLNMYNDILNGHQLDKADQYLAEDYIQHNPYAATGREGFVSFFTPFIKENPDYKVNLRGMIGQGDLVAVFTTPDTAAAATTTTDSNESSSSTESAANTTAATPGAVVDIYRIADGKIAEHWDVSQSAGSNTDAAALQNLLPSTSTEVKLANTDRATVAANASFVSNFFKSFFNEHNTDIANEAVNENVTQHGSDIQNGRSALISHYLTQFRSNPNTKATVTNTIAEGDLVLVHSHMQTSDTDRGNAVITIFRVNDGQIAEMWTLSQPVPEQSANDNTMF
ncbi:nuclear transport factor 2 family protein [Paenibacillus kandeliae]|uniref:nuclear transport factor 2 family protein n=1 Tax=Paenibacillus kandeliae TaxID=3231269 RepID=UPI0034577B25